MCTMEILPVPPLYRLQGENSGFSKKLMNKQASSRGSPASAMLQQKQRLAMIGLLLPTLAL